MIRRIIIVSFLLSSFLGSQPLMAQQEGTGTGKWELLGVRAVQFTSDRDAIPVTNNKGIYRAIKLKVFNGNIKLYRFVVFFDDGQFTGICHKSCHSQRGRNPGPGTERKRRVNKQK